MVLYRYAITSITVITLIFFFFPGVQIASIVPAVATHFQLVQQVWLYQTLMIQARLRQKRCTIWHVDSVDGLPEMLESLIK